jgi:hypothetical protein
MECGGIRHRSREGVGQHCQAKNSTRSSCSKAFVAVITTTFVTSQAKGQRAQSLELQEETGRVDDIIIIQQKEADKKVEVAVYSRRKRFIN